jgi:hypothetical protein
VLNENDDLGWLPAETAAAMRDLAGTVTDAPPLRLTAEATGLSPARPRRPPRGPRFRWSWGAPLLAAVTVVAVAVALVIVKNLPNDRVAPQVTEAGRITDALPGYYVAIHPASLRPGAPNGLFVGDTRTGKMIADIAPPAFSTIVSVSGAADDRTFAVTAAPTSGGQGVDDAFYLLTITTGGAPAARLTKLPIEPLPGVIAIALSASGKELAVAMASKAATGSSVRELHVYSVVTGWPVRSWSTVSTSAIISDAIPGVLLGQYAGQYPALRWIGEDRAIAFPVLTPAGRTSTSRYSLEVRSVSVTEAGGDLMATSKVITDLGGSGSSAGPCGTFFPVLSGNGSTLFCLMSSGPGGHTSPDTVRWVLEWRPMRTTLADGAEWRSFPYIKTIDVPAGSAVYPATVWSSTTGARLLIEWSVVTPGQGTSVRLGELALGDNSWTFTPLPAPASFAPGGLQGIAW